MKFTSVVGHAVSAMNPPPLSSLARGEGGAGDNLSLYKKKGGCSSRTVTLTPWQPLGTPRGGRVKPTLFPSARIDAGHR
jgi:hypothetical protein